MSSATKTFSRIYENDLWNGGSGQGSTEEYTVAYRAELEKLLEEWKVETVLDIGCGDWQSTKLIDWKGANYLGVDCVPSLIEQNTHLYAKEGKVQFQQIDVLEQYSEITEIYDLIILKDVIQHWSNQQIYSILPHLILKGRRILLINCNYQRSDHQDISIGDFRPLSAHLFPLRVFCPKKIFSWRTKDMLLIENRNQKS